MKKIKLYNKIAKLGSDMFDRNIFEVSEDVLDPDGILIRSASLRESLTQSGRRRTLKESS